MSPNANKHVMWWHIWQCSLLSHMAGSCRMTFVTLTGLGQIYSGIACGRVLSGELYTDRFQRIWVALKSSVFSYVLVYDSFRVLVILWIRADKFTSEICVFVNLYLKNECDDCSYDLDICLVYLSEMICCVCRAMSHLLICCSGWHL